MLSLGSLFSIEQCTFQYYISVIVISILNKREKQYFYKIKRNVF